MLLELKNDGITSILISHKINEVSKVMNQITVIRDGAVIETLVKGTDNICENRIIKGMVGRELVDSFPKRTSKIGEVAFDVRDRNVYDPLIEGKKIIKDVSIKVRKGEVVGLSGLMGAGRTEFAMSVFGKSFSKHITGKIIKDGREIVLNSVRKAIEHGLAYAKEDRKSSGLILIDSIMRNITLSNHGEISNRMVTDENKGIKVAEEYCKKLNIKSSSILQKTGNLSGGNQQKVMLSKWIFAHLYVLILDEPTRGIDVGAKLLVYSIMKYRKMLSIIVSMILAVALLGGCGQKQTETKPAEAPKATEAPKAAEGIYIPVISKGVQHQFWQAVKMGAEKAAKDLNVKITFEGPESEAQVDKQIEMLTAALGKNPKAICLAALDSKACIPLLEKAKAANIPVVGFDSGVDSDIPVATAATNNIAAAALAADKMAELIGGEGKVAVIVHDQTSRTGVDRRDGFVKRIEEKYPKIKIVTVQYGGGDHLKSTDIAKVIIQSNPDLKGLFGANEGSAIGALNGVIEMKKEGKIVVVGYDAGKQQKDAIRSGKMAGAITQDPVGIGYKAAELKPLLYD